MTADDEAPEGRSSLAEHARRLDEAHPDGPLPGNGHPLPDDAAHRTRRAVREPDPRMRGAAAADLLADYFAAPHGDVARLEAALHAVDVPYRKNDHVHSMALRADPDVVLSTGRRLVEHGQDRCGVSIGLALLAVHRLPPESVEVVLTLGLLSDTFAPLAAEALVRARGGHLHLHRLAERSTGWGRVTYVEDLLRWGGSQRDWLLRHACDGDFRNGYFAGAVALRASLHEAITRESADDALIDHTGRLLHVMSYATGMGIDLAGYPPAPLVLAAWVRHLSGQEATGERASVAIALSHELRSREPARVGCTPDERTAVLDGLDRVLGRPDWVVAAAEEIDWSTGRGG
ncbi:hypothetical protein [Oerskovia jenensis]|uniref:hypothetical protein n=1 Tax=Oerskovia jenensis TaxID=162169 RepID=UPI0036DF8405